MRSALVALGGFAIVTPAAMGVADTGDDPPGSRAVTTAATGQRAPSTHSAAVAAGTSVLGSEVPAAADHPSPTAAPAADVRLTVTAPPTVRAGGSFAYTLRLTNHGTATPSSVVVRILLPEGTVRTGARLPDGVGGEADGRFGQLVLPPLGPGASSTMTITVRAPRSGTLVNTTRITFVEGVRGARPYPAVTTVTRVRQGP